MKAEFEADFTKFNTAVDQATGVMKNFESGAAKVETKLNAMADSFSGRKLVQDATLMVKAVEDIGGASILTERELARVANTADAAAEKLRAMGQAVPEDLQHYADLAKDAGDRSDSLGTRVTGLVEAFHAAQAAMADAVGTAKDWITAAGEQEAATVRLETALRNQGTATPEVIEQYEALQKHFEQTTVASDEMVAQMQATLVTIGKVMPQDMKAALTAVTDLAAGLRIDLPTATQMVAKALEGNTTALHRQGIEIDSLALKTQGAQAVFDAIARTMGGAATAQAATFEGQMKRLGNESNNAKESLGQLVEGGLKPALDAFHDLPPAVQSGILVTAELAKEGASLATGMAGVAASVALAMPLLGMEPAAAGAAVLEGLSTAAAGAAAAVPLLTLALVDLWLAMKEGQREDTKSAIAVWALSSDDLAAKLARLTLGIQQMTPEQAKAANAMTAAGEAARTQSDAVAQAAEHLKNATGTTHDWVAALEQAKDRVAQLDQSTQNQIVAAKEMGATIKDLATRFEMSETEINLVIEANKRLAESNKKVHDDAMRQHEEFKKAVEDARAAQEGWQAVIARMTPTMVEYAKSLMAAGVPLNEIKILLHLTTVEMAALVKSKEDDVATTKKQEEADKHGAEVQAKALEETTKLWDDYNKRRVEDSGTTMDAQLAALDKWYADAMAKAQKAGTDTDAFYTALAADYDQQYNRIIGKVGGTAKDMTEQTQRGLEQTAEYAQNMYEQMAAKAGTVSQATIDNYRKIAEAAQFAARTFNAEFQQAFNDVDAQMNKLLKDALTTFASIGQGSAVGGGADIAALMKQPKGPSPYATSTPIFGNVYTPAPPVTVNVSGVWDPASVQPIAQAVGDQWMKQSGRQFGAA